LVNNATSTPSRKQSPRELNGDEQLQRIGRAGRQWKATIGRKIDMESEPCYMFDSSTAANWMPM
jgi:hypothetical protein